MQVNLRIEWERDIVPFFRLGHTRKHYVAHLNRWFYYYKGRKYGTERDTVCMEKAYNEEKRRYIPIDVVSLMYQWYTTITKNTAIRIQRWYRNIRRKKLIRGRAMFEEIFMLSDEEKLSEEDEDEDTEMTIV